MLLPRIQLHSTGKERDLAFFSPNSDGYSIIFQTLSTRILAAGWWLFGLCVLLTFAVSFQAFLQVDQATPNYKVTDISTLIANENFEFKSVKGGSTEAFLKVMINHAQPNMRP